MENSPPVAVSTEPAGALLAEPAAPKKKRNLPGMPDPDAEVIALSPTTLMATNRFVCEICSKGFQRDQNLQLHRRGHNLPWKLKQRTGKDPPRKRVFVCPEPSCVHHNPARALGDLTGIKKHFCRKHGEKKWKCERCTKRYAVHSDWKAHMKVCGTKEYRCDCGTLFSRRDSFITHRAFCDALAEEARAQPQQIVPVVQPSERYVVPSIRNVASPPPPPQTPSTTVVSPVLSIQSSDLPENAAADAFPAPAPATDLSSVGHAGTSFSGGALPPPPPSRASPSTLSGLLSPLSATSDRVGGGSLPSPSAEPSASLSLFLSSTATSIFSRPPEQTHIHYAPVTQPPPPAMSATALLQKAAQMGATASNSSLLRGLGLAMSSSYETIGPSGTTTSAPSDWSGLAKPEPYDPVGYGLGLGLAPIESPGLMMGHQQPSLFGPKPATLDFLGLGGPRTGLSALLTSLEEGFGAGPVGSYGEGSGGGGAWSGDGGDRNGPTFL